jgi:hypothetical protein
MSDGPQGHGWWQASDRKWYPPEDQYTASLPPPPVASTAAQRPAGPQQLSDVERAQLLTQELAFLTQPTSYTGTVGPTGTVSLGARGPKIKQRGKFSAVVWTGMDYAHPAYFVLHLLFTVMTCGIYLPFWWWGLRKKPKVYTVAVDEQGNITHTQHEISMAQRIQRWVVLVVMVWWLWQAVRLLNAFQAASGHHP